jgi:hypothetical protein
MREYEHGQEIELKYSTFKELQDFMLESESFDQAVLRALHYAKYFERR